MIPTCATVASRGAAFLLGLLFLAHLRGTTAELSVLGGKESGVEWFTAVDGAVDPTRYNHDSSLILHHGEWVLGWNGNSDAREGVFGQKNYFSRAKKWNDLRGQPHVAEFQSSEWSTNPVSPDGIEWHPTLLEFDGRLECWWFSTSTPSFPRSIGYKSVWNDGTRKWTNYKIQMLPGGRITFSDKVRTAEPNDRLPLGRLTYIPMPLATAIRARKGEIVMPMIISPAPTGGVLGGPNEVVVYVSADNGNTWSWKPPLPKEDGPQRDSVWEPWMTWDGQTYRLFCRNFGRLLPGKGYSIASTRDLGKWGALKDAAIDVMPMRGETIADSKMWYVALSERPQIGETSPSPARRALSLYRSRNGEDWQVVAPLLPVQTTGYYCWLHSPGDGYLYFSATTTPAITVGRVPVPAADKFYITAERKISVAAPERPFCDGKEITLVGSEVLRLPANFEAGKGFSFAALVRTGPGHQAVALDFMREEAKTWGNGFMPILDGGWRLGFPNWITEIRGEGYTARSQEMTFVGYSFDETDHVLRIVRRNESDSWQTKEWFVRTMYMDRLPPVGTVTTINGHDYCWRNTAVGSTDIQLLPNPADSLRSLASTLQRNDSEVRAALVSQMYTTGAKGVRNHLMIFFATTPKVCSGDGKYIRNDGNTFDVPHDHITFNGINRLPDARIPESAAGIQLWRFGMWNRPISTDEFKSLFNGLNGSHSLPLEPTAASLSWNSAKLILDPKDEATLPDAIEQPGHTALLRDQGIAIYGEGAAAMEVPGVGDWEWSAEFCFDEFPEGHSRDLLSVGNKFSLGQLQIAHEAKIGYLLMRNEKMICSLEPGTWVPIKLRYHGGNAEVVLPKESILRISVRPLLSLGRWFSDRVEPPEINRTVKEKTLWRNIGLTMDPEKRF